MLDPDKALAQLESRDKAAAEEQHEELPPTTVIDLDCLGFRGRRYQGRFIYRVPTLGMNVQIAQLKDQYLPGGGRASPADALLVEQICYLEVCLQAPRPEWYKPLHLYDAIPIGTLYGEAIKYEARFLGPAPKSGEDAATTGRAANNGGPHLQDQGAVGRKVQPPAERRETLVAHGEGSSRTG